MNEIIVCPTFLVAKALSRMEFFYRLWEQYRGSPVPAFRIHAITAKAQGIVWHDRTLACSIEYEEAPKPMKKNHGPAFRQELKPLMQCGTCRGTGVVSGVFHQLDCVACHGSGWVCQATGDALPLEDLVPQLNMKLRNMADELSRARQSIGGAHEQYEQNNRRGAGGSNFTGD